MGTDACYQALPEECALLAAAREEPEIAQSIQFVSFWLRGSRTMLTSDTRIRAMIAELRRSHPGVEDRRLDLEREFDVLHYLLSATRRGEVADRRDRLLDAAILGAAPLSVHAVATQGAAVRWVTEADARSIAEILSAVSPRDLGAHWDPPQLEKNVVYKFFADRVDDETWPSVMRHFSALREFYATAAAHREGVLVCID